VLFNFGIQAKKFLWSYSTGPRQKQTAAQFLYHRDDSHEAGST